MMLTTAALALILTVVFAAGAFRQWRHGNTKSSVAFGVIALFMAVGAWGISDNLKNATPIDLIKQPTSCRGKLFPAGCG